MSSEIIAAVIGAILSGVITWFFTKSDLGQKNQLLEGQIRDSNDRINNLNSKLESESSKALTLSSYKQKYENVKSRLENSRVVKEHIQPVILIGPRAVGKSSLLAQWHAPWDHSRLNPTSTHNTCTIPIYDFSLSNTERHFADPEILTGVDIHLKIKVHDFPGELKAQENIIKVATSEARALRRNTGKDLGIVVICMFNSEEAKHLSQSTIDYYNGDLFNNLRKAVSHSEIHIERLIFVFNKFDLLKEMNLNYNELDLQKYCINSFAPVISLLRGICNHEKVCEVFSILSRENMTLKNQGAPIILGETARKFVESMAGPQAAKEIIHDSASNYVAPIFS